MRLVYRTCAEDKGRGVTNRSIDRIDAVLSDVGHCSAFASLARETSDRLVSTDRIPVQKNLQSVSRILRRMYVTMDELLEERVEGDAEVAARAHVQQLLPRLLTDWEQINADLQAVMARYGVQPQFEPSPDLVVVKTE